ncbi:unnamed protein product [Schistosoma curassoni]|uniref:Secreted protein n=1 Tax=Schistosoma curassoni TaxID=6186 RepID=A0A183KZS3_9TREM|nr:unnamed protein product [Schistosoma curassoni]
MLLVFSSNKHWTAFPISSKLLRIKRFRIKRLLHLLSSLLLLLLPRHLLAHQQSIPLIQIRPSIFANQITWLKCSNI